MACRLLVLWDLDLTLLDPAGFGSRAFAAILPDLIDRPAAVNFSFAGMTDRAICERVLQLNGLDPADTHPGGSSWLETIMGRFTARCRGDAASLRAHGGGPLPGAQDALSAVASASDVIQGVATGNARDTALVKLGECGLDSWLDGTIGGYGDAHLDRRGLVTDSIASAGGLVAADTAVVVVGDTVHDVRGALAAGATAVGVCTGHTSSAQLLAAGAREVLPDLTDISAVLAALDRAAASTYHGDGSAQSTYLAF